MAGGPMAQLLPRPCDIANVDRMDGKQSFWHMWKSEPNGDSYAVKDADGIDCCGIPQIILLIPKQATGRWILTRVIVWSLMDLAFYFVIQLRR